MDLKEYNKTINQLSDILILKYFNGDRKKSRISISQLMVKFGKNDYENFTVSQPISTAYFRNNFQYLCQKKPDLVRSIVYLNSNESKNLVNDLNKVSHSGKIMWNEIPSINTLAAAEQIFEVAKQKIKKLFNQEKPLKKDTNEILKLIEPLSGAKNNKDIQQVYWMLYCELRFTLQLLKPYKDFNLSFGFDKEWLNLRETDVPLLNLLNKTSLQEYTKSTFRQNTVIKLKGIYNNYKIPVQQSNKPSVVSDSVIKIKMVPSSGRPADNIIIINNNEFDKVQNVHFELLYYLLWLRYHNLDVSTGLEMNETINPEHINEMTGKNVMIKRFGAVWNNAINPGMKYAKSTAVSDINKILKIQLKINFVAIKEDSGYYKLSSRFKQQNIELAPF